MGKLPKIITHNGDSEPYGVYDSENNRRQRRVNVNTCAANNEPRVFENALGYGKRTVNCFPSRVPGKTQSSFRVRLLVHGSAGGCSSVSGARRWTVSNGPTKKPRPARGNDDRRRPGQINTDNSDDGNDQSTIGDTSLRVPATSSSSSSFPEEEVTCHRKKYTRATVPTTRPSGRRRRGTHVWTGPSAWHDWRLNFGGARSFGHFVHTRGCGQSVGVKGQGEGPLGCARSPSS